MRYPPRRKGVAEHVILPVTGPVFLDPGGFIQGVDRIEPSSVLLEPKWRLAPTGQFTFVRSDLVVLETPVKPMRDSDNSVEDVSRSLSDTDEASSIPTTRSLLKERARLQADTDLKTPDALHATAAMSHDAAAAMSLECTVVVTSDSEFRRVQALSVVTLDYLLDEKTTNLEVVERTVALLADCS